VIRRKEAGYSFRRKMVMPIHMSLCSRLVDMNKGKYLEDNLENADPPIFA